MFEPDETWAACVQTGALRAQSEWNRRGGVDGVPLELVRLPKTARWRNAGAQLARFIVERDLCAVIGPSDRAAAHVAAQVATRLRVPIITLCSDPALTAAKDPWIFCAAACDREPAAHGSASVLSVPGDGRHALGAALGHGAMHAVARAAEATGASRDSIREGLARIRRSPRRAGLEWFRTAGKREERSNAGNAPATDAVCSGKHHE